MKKTILVIGANGQLGTVLTQSLQLKYGKENIVASDLRPRENYDGIFEILDATDVRALEKVVLKYHIGEIYHLAAILSANGEKDPLHTWGVNMKALLNVLEVSRHNGMDKVFFPSTIAVFGEGASQENTCNNEPLHPLTSYGISKVAGENWGLYYFSKYGLDVRSLRYPGVIGYQSNAGGGTTDYAVEIFHSAVLEKPFTCFLDGKTTLPMIFIDDAIRATLELMDAPKESIKVRTSYNISGISFSPEEVVSSIRKIYPNFEVNYVPDHRQDIASKWPKTINDKEAKQDWGWRPEYDMEKITNVMVYKLKERYNVVSK
ncbi:nucleoside-diphosphate-sugar epimerase [Saonia flava]|uniref:Nucleoside-diphosphate-sugar epimerase n=1 Tax=Saonia flava TaxID=523696 RepID=A0A846QZ74_9FLAO|nr:NAD-dependent epimerase/dehydratase family protein [Saonia flava]NJB71942.1 nucleoside-diphosphate-sugar epimerase [Saonia flava]